MILIGHSPPDGNECTNYQTAVDRSRLEVELNCSYDGRSVAICVLVDADFRCLLVCPLQVSCLQNQDYQFPIFTLIYNKQHGSICFLITIIISTAHAHIKTYVCLGVDFSTIAACSIYCKTAIKSCRIAYSTTFCCKLGDVQLKKLDCLWSSNFVANQLSLHEQCVPTCCISLGEIADQKLNAWWPYGRCGY